MANTQFVINFRRFDPYKSFKFLVRFDGRIVAGISKVTALKQSTEPVSFREGGDQSTTRVTPGVWKFEPITLERGVTHDPEFENWARLIWNTEQGDTAISLENFRKELSIELHNEQGVVVKVDHVHRCWVSSYQALPDLDANANAVAIESMVIQNEGWSRDPAYTEPQQT